MGASITVSDARVHRDTHIHSPRCQTSSVTGVRHLPLGNTGSTEMERKMKCSTWCSVSRLSHFILTSSLHHVTVLNSSSCQGCGLFHSWQQVSLCELLLVYLPFCHSLTTPECHHENTSMFSPSLPPTTNCSQSCTQGLPMELCVGQAPGPQNGTGDKRAPAWPSNG